VRRLFVERNGGTPGRPRAFWRLLGQFAVFVVSVTLFTSLLSVVWLFSGGEREATVTQELFLIGSSGSVLAALLSMWLAARFLDRRPFREFGFRFGAGWWLDLLFGMALGALLMSGIFAVELLFGWVTVTGTFETADPGTPFALAILAPLTAFLCVGVYEEMVYRGYQLRNIAEGLNYPALGPRGAILAALLLSSTLFGLLHAANPNSTITSAANLILAGIMLGTGYVLTGDLAIPIGLHITWNLFQGNVFGFPVSGIESMGATFISVEQGGPALWTGGVFGPEAGFIGVAAMICGVLLTLLWVRLRRGRAGIHTPIAEGPKETAAGR
jgi:membrane protease YdiL (CAAX protease family)